MPQRPPLLFLGLVTTNCRKRNTTNGRGGQKVKELLQWHRNKNTERHLDKWHKWSNSNRARPTFDRKTKMEKKLKIKRSSKASNAIKHWLVFQNPLLKQVKVRVNPKTKTCHQDDLHLLKLLVDVEKSPDLQQLIDSGDLIKIGIKAAHWFNFFIRLVFCCMFFNCKWLYKPSFSKWFLILIFRPLDVQLLTSGLA